MMLTYQLVIFSQTPVVCDIFKQHNARHNRIYYNPLGHVIRQG
jgi:hypothetical protein